MTHTQSDFERRRDALADAIGGGIAVLPAATEVIRNHDVPHPFRQDSDFWFLTGFEEPDAFAVIDPQHPDERYVLFVRPKDREREIWDGYRAGVEGAREMYGADAAFPLDELDAELLRRFLGRSAVYAPLANTAFSERVTKIVNKVRELSTRAGYTVPTELRDTGPLLSEQRLRKSPPDIEALRCASQLSAAGHREAVRFTKPGLYEYQVQAAMEYVWRIDGAQRDGYPSIVGSGPNACVLHYGANNRRMQDGELLLIDAAAEFDYFSADITRTFPVNGRFSAPQRAVYNVVLASQKAAIEECRPGATSKDTHLRSTAVVAEGLVEIGLLPGPVEAVMAKHLYREFFMHGTSHWLGLDVHDAGTYGVDGKPRPLEPGMSFTVEPGVYIDPHRESVRLSNLEYDFDEWADRRLLRGAKAAKALEEEERDAAGWTEHPIPEEFRGIGVRIEDDILVTEDGHENMTADAPVEPDELEELWKETPQAVRS